MHMKCKVTCNHLDEPLMRVQQGHFRSFSLIGNKNACDAKGPFRSLDSIYAYEA